MKKILCLFLVGLPGLVWAGPVIQVPGMGFVILDKRPDDSAQNAEEPKPSPQEHPILERLRSSSLMLVDVRQEGDRAQVNLSDNESFMALRDFPPVPSRILLKASAAKWAREDHWKRFYSEVRVIARTYAIVDRESLELLGWKLEVYSRGIPDDLPLRQRTQDMVAVFTAEGEYVAEAEAILSDLTFSKSACASFLQNQYFAQKK